MLNFCKDDAPLLIMLGQSNTYGHNAYLPEAERILEPLKNVHGLSRRENFRLGLEQVTWSGYTSAGMNLGMLENQDHTCCLATCFARQWQDRIDRGEDLPDLYIVSISRGAQGVNEYDLLDGVPINMWWPDRPPVLKYDENGELDVSLFPLTMELLSLVRSSLTGMGKRIIPLGVHWNQWEAEVCNGIRAVRDFPAQFDRIRKGIREALGMDYPLFLYRPLSEFYEDPSVLGEMIQILEKIAREPDVAMLDLRSSPMWDPDCQDHGIFQADCVHYTARVQQWFALQQWQALL